ncbi:MAG: type V CRISPR-associated protein Cas12a/Cpf1 [Paludibacteraceae bacterium]|nr:type V CRISPR-associated protein Cas12a/Cpf1 [Paludibacteraceae bacterium]
MKNLKQFTGLYPVSKTLRFELQPIGKTKENIEKNGILSRDEKRAEDYKIVKTFIDEYHKQFIKERLWGFTLPLISEGHLDSLEEYQSLYEMSKRNDSQEAEFSEVKDNLRSIIAKRLTESGSAYERIFKKELIREDLIDFLEKEGDKEIVRQFADFTTYFGGFHENRKNMYSAKEKSTAIAYRLIHQNLPKFMDNMKAFTKIAETSVAEHFADIYEGWKEYLNVGSIEEIFRLDYFSETLTQPHIEVYNYIIGKKILEDGTEVKGINEYVNLYNQQQKDKSQRLPFLVPLYKQILSDREKLSWLTEEFDSDDKMLTAINELYAHLHDLLMSDENDSLRSLLIHIKDFNLTQINITNDLSLTDISQHLFCRYDVFTNGIKDELRKITPRKKRESDEDFEDRISKIFNTQKSFSINFLDKLPQPVMEDGKPRSIADYFMTLGAVNTQTTQKENLFAQIENAYEEARAFLQMKDTGNALSQNKPAVAKIKSLLDALKDLQHFIKPLLGSGEENEKDELFYGSFQMMWDELDTITPLYNKVRNWLTRKPYSTEKIKLNFDNSQLLGGWDVNKEPDCTGVLLRKDGLYYLGIMDKRANHIFEADVTPKDGDCYEKMVYKQLGQISQQLPRIAFSKSWQQKISTSEDVIRIKKTESFKKNNDDLQKLISYYKSFISQHDEWNNYFNIKFSNRSNYKNLPDFYSEVDTQFYTLLLSKVSVSYINQLVNEGKLYLFRIWNKDFSEFSKGTPNLHTLYWKMLFDERNLTDVVYKLNGQAEVFYRKASIQPENKVIHQANKPIDNKNELNEKRTSTFEYDIIKDKRYTVDKFQFHVPITINFKAIGQTNINPIVQDAIKQGDFSHIIGIDRGERHLLYLSLIDLKGNIVKQMTLNDIVNEYKGQTYKTNYHYLLAKREGERTDARRSWETIETIKELKEGYLSQIVHIISKMMVEYNAIVVLEDLNTGFMRGRQKIERQVYEKFEKMLIEKLNCYIDKHTDPSDNNGLLHPLQLTCESKNWKRSHQCGCLFYIPAWNTSKIDPVTGFVNLLDTRYDTREKARVFFSKFQRISFNAEKGWFEFALDYNDFTTKAEGTRTQWTLCSYGERIRTFRNPQRNHQWDNERVVLTDALKQLFDKYNIDIYGNIKEAISAQTDAQFFKELLGLMKLMLQMRNSITNSEEDYLMSPIADNAGHFFDSREGISSLPIDADANGAYNIARKGLWVIRKIQETSDGAKPSLTITNKEWLQFAQTKPYLND